MGLDGYILNPKTKKIVSIICDKGGVILSSFHDGPSLFVVPESSRISPAMSGQCLNYTYWWAQFTYYKQKFTNYKIIAIFKKCPLLVLSIYFLKHGVTGQRMRLTYNSYPFQLGFRSVHCQLRTVWRIIEIEKF